MFKSKTPFCHPRRQVCLESIVRAVLYCNMRKIITFGTIAIWHPLKDANQAVVDMGEGKVRYRYVLVNESHAKM